HHPLFVELPILVAIATKPVARIIMPFICKAHGYPVVAKRPDLFDQPILQLANPLAYKERLDGLAATNELDAVAPDAVQRIGKSYFGRIARVPGIFGEARLLRGRFCGERRKWRSIHFQCLYAHAKKNRDKSPPGSVSPGAPQKENHARIQSLISRQKTRPASATGC